MEQFSLKEYLKNPKRKIITRNGYPARIICTDADSGYCVIGLVYTSNREEVAVSYYANGTRWTDSDSESDLFFAPEMRTGWINIYHYDGVGNANASRRIFNTKEEAIASESKGRIDTIKIEWEE